MNNKNVLVVLVAALMTGGCCSQCVTLDVSERQLLDVRHDHLRCEVYLDRLRDLYNVLDEEPGGIMDEELDAIAETTTTGIPAFDGPLTGRHDGPLTGRHDGPLTRGHDDPLTGRHDDIDDMREATMWSAQQCWDTVDELVERYNECVAEFVTCRDNGDPDCHPNYLTCLENNRPPGF